MSSEADLLTRYLEIINHREQDAWSEGKSVV